MKFRLVERPQHHMEGTRALVALERIQHADVWHFYIIITFKAPTWTYVIKISYVCPLSPYKYNREN